MVAEETLVSKEAPFKESAWDHHLNSLLEDLHSIGTPRDGRALEPNVKHTTNEYISPDNRTHTRTERYEYQAGIPYENGSNQKIVQHSSMMYRSSRHSDSRSDSRGDSRTSSLKKVPALSRSESLNRSESLRRRARDPSPDLRLTMHDDIQYASPPPPLPTQRLKQNIVELDSLLHDLNTSRTETARHAEKTRGTSISYGVTSEGTQTETPKTSVTELRSPAMLDPISHSTPNQQRKQISTFSSSEYYQDGFQSAHPPTSSYKSYSTEHLQPAQSTSSRAYSSEHISSHRDASPIPPPATDSDSDPHAKTIVKNYHYYYTVDGTLKPGAPPSGVLPSGAPPSGTLPSGAPPSGYPHDTTHTSSTTTNESKSYHYNYVIGPDGQPVPGSQPPHGAYHPPHSKSQPPEDPESSKTVVTHRAYNYSWSSQGPPAADGHPSPDKPDRYYIVEDGRPNEPYTRHPGKRPSDKPKPFPVSPQDERPNSGINYPSESHSYHYTWDSRRDPGAPPTGPPYHTLPGKRDSSPSPHNTTTINSYNYSWSYPGQPESPGLHPTPPTQPADTKPPKRLDDLMASFSDIEDAPPTPPMQDKRPHRIELTPAPIHVSASAEAVAAAKADAETAPLVEKKTVTIEKSVNKAGSPVYYPPSYSDPKPLQETPKPTPMWRMEMEKEKMKGKYKYRESESKSEFKAIPLCLPLCCAAPLCCEIM